VARIKSLLAGRCQPRHLLDVRYEACVQGLVWRFRSPLHTARHTPVRTSKS
jgi:hypothetical protein